MKPAIITPVIAQLVEETRALILADRDADALVTAYDRKLSEQRDIAKARRIELGMKLRKAKEILPKRGTKENGWGSFLEAIEMPETTAIRYMQEAGYVSPRTSANPPAVVDSERDDVPPPTDDDAPAPVEPDLVLTATERGARDSWCTPAEIADVLPEVDLDPCSNPRSLIRAKRTYSLEADQNGLALPWFGLVYVNGPYSNLMPWGAKLDSERPNVVGAGFLVNADHSPQWWRCLIRHLTVRLDFDKRLEFIAPPGVDPSTNDRPQTLLMDEPFLAACSPELAKIGTLWTIRNRG